VNPLDILPIVLIFGVMYLLLVRPQMQERASHDKLIESLVKDDAVVTSSGIHGKITSVADQTVVLEIGDRTRVTIDKSSVARRQGEPTPQK